MLLSKAYKLFLNRMFVLYWPNDSTHEKPLQFGFVGFFFLRKSFDTSVAA